MKIQVKSVHSSESFKSNSIGFFFIFFLCNLNSFMICLDVIFFVFSFCLGFAEFKSGLVSLIRFSKDWAIISSYTAVAFSWGLSWVFNATLLVTVQKPPTCVNSGNHSVHSSWFVLCLTWWSFTLSMVGFLVLSKHSRGSHEDFCTSSSSWEFCFTVSVTWAPRSLGVRFPQLSETIVLCWESL